MAKDRNKPNTTTTRSTPRTTGRTAERRKERERERRQRQLITGGIVVVALVVLAVFIFLVVNAPAEAPIPEAALTRYDGIQQTTTEEGYPRLGDPGSPVQVVEYSSFDCPHCRDFHDESIDAILQRVRAGEIAFTYVPLYGFGSVANGQGAAAAAVCAGEQGKFWQFHDALFDWQGVYVNQAFTNNRINAGVDALELDRSAYNACVGSSATNDVLNAARTQAQALLNFNGTPTIAINGVVPVGEDQQPISDSASVLARIDAEVVRLGRSPTAQPPTEVPVEPTDELTAEPTSEATEPVMEMTPEVTPETTPAS